MFFRYHLFKEGNAVSHQAQLQELCTRILNCLLPCLGKNKKGQGHVQVKKVGHDHV